MGSSELFFHMKDACRLFPKGDGFFFVGMIKWHFSVKTDIGITFYMFYVLKTKPKIHKAQVHKMY